MEARLSSEDKTRIIERLNRRRSETAVGLSKLPPAGDMLKLVIWFYNSYINFITDFIND